VSFKLLYRGTRDGFTADKFHTLCDNKKNTVTLVTSTLKKIFGGFAEENWNITSNYKNSKNAFLFSITEKDKFKIKIGTGE